MAGLVPPWHHYVPYMRSFISDPYRPIWHPPLPEAGVDMNRLLIEWAIIAALAIAAYVLLKEKHHP